MSNILDDTSSPFDDDFNLEQEEDGAPVPVDPSKYATWLYIRHNHDDDGRRFAGWWKHNQEFSTLLDVGSVLVKYTLANIGLMNADAIQLDYLTLIDGKVTVTSKNFQLKSGEVQVIEEGFDLLGDKPEDVHNPIGSEPWITIRATDFTTPAPSIREITDALLAFHKDRQTAIALFLDWKRYPSLFTYPCCAPFPGSPIE